MALVLDTGPILALLDAADPDHDACVAMVDQIAEDLVVPATVLVEVDYWVLKLLGADTWAMSSTTSLRTSRAATTVPPPAPLPAEPERGPGHPAGQCDACSLNPDTAGKSRRPSGCCPRKPQRRGVDSDRYGPPRPGRPLLAVQGVLISSENGEERAGEAAIGGGRRHTEPPEAS
jgi:hypothetical protein